MTIAAEHGDGWVVAGGVDEEVGDLVEPALMLADDVQDAAEDCRALRVYRRCAELEACRWRPFGLVGVSGEQQPPGTDDGNRPAVHGQPESLGERFHLGDDACVPRRGRLVGTGPRSAGSRMRAAQIRVAEPVGDRDGPLDIVDRSGRGAPASPV